jgi:hypothetical protein
VPPRRWSLRRHPPHPRRSNAQFYRTVSDHLPIMVRLRTSGPDDD